MSDEQGTALTERVDQPQRAISAFSSESNFEAAKRMAMVFATSSLVPDAYKGKEGVANTLIAMELANRLGASPLMVMQNLHIINNRPGWASSFLIATVNACGRFTPLRFKFEGQEGEDTWGCRAVAVDKDTGDECTGSLITIGLAKAEGWWSKKDKKGNEVSKWPTMTEQMLMYRSAAFWTRVYAPELSLGIHTADEVVDMGDGRQVRSVGAQDLNAALEEVEEAVVVADEETTKPAPTVTLQKLMAQAAEQDLLADDALSEYQLVLHDAKPKEVANAVKELEKLVGEQGDLLGKEG